MKKILNLKDFIHTHSNLNQPIVGLDIGSKRIGVSISDIRWVIASPYKLIEHKKFTLTAQIIHDLCIENKACGIVVGLPLNMDGSYGPKAQSIKDFALNLINLYDDIDVAFWDERLSTVAVETTLIKADVTRKKRKKVVDKMASSYILQGFLDYTNNLN